MSSLVLDEEACVSDDDDDNEVIRSKIDDDEEEDIKTFDDISGSNLFFRFFVSGLGLLCLPYL